MCSDWDRQKPGMRKAWGYKEALGLHSAVGGFLHFLRVLKDKVASTEYEKRHKNLFEQFNMGVLDHDVVHALEASAPPADLGSVSFLRLGRGVLAEAYCCSTQDFRFRL